MKLCKKLCKLNVKTNVIMIIFKVIKRYTHDRMFSYILFSFQYIVQNIFLFTKGLVELYFFSCCIKMLNLLQFFCLFISHTDNK